MNLSFQQINIARGYCWGPSASEGPQKRDLTMFSKYASRYLRNQVAGIQKHGQDEAWLGRRSWRRIRWSRSYAQRSFGVITEKETDLKGKRLFRPRWITIESLANVKGMGVILHGLRPVPINRWTVLPYCSRWLGICFCVTLVFFIFLQAEGTLVIWYHFCFSLIIK